VWVPDSRLWLSVAASRPDAVGIVPEEAASLASSPVVLALREPLARALGWPSRPLSWTDVIGAFNRPDVWASAGHPEWAGLRIGITDPAKSTAGLATVLAILGPDSGGAVTEAQLIAGLSLSRVVGALAPETSEFFAAQESAPAAGTNAAVAAFPALERDLAVHNAVNSAMPMVPVYDADSPIVADYPYAVLSGNWVSEADRATGDQFRRYLLTPPAQQILGEAGLRGPDRAILSARLMPAGAGFESTIASPRATPDPSELNGVMAEWTNLQRRVNLLVVLDTSGSMSAAIPGTPLTRLSLIQQIAGTGFSLLPNTMSIGLWEFSVRPNDASEYRELVPFGPVVGNAGSTPRGIALAGAIPQLHAEGFTPLYNTIYAAFHEMQQRWEPGSTNSVVLLTDGINDLNGGLALDDLVSQLVKEQRPDKPVQVVCIGMGPDTDESALSRVAEATGGRSYVVSDSAAAIQTLVLAFTGRVQ
jgi:Ca-activated chloride channel family protein